MLTEEMALERVRAINGMSQRIDANGCMVFNDPYVWVWFGERATVMAVVADENRYARFNAWNSPNHQNNALGYVDDVDDLENLLVYYGCPHHPQYEVDNGSVPT